MSYAAANHCPRLRCIPGRGATMVLLAGHKPLALEAGCCAVQQRLQTMARGSSAPPRAAVSPAPPAGAAAQTETGAFGVADGTCAASPCSREQDRVTRGQGKEVHAGDNVTTAWVAGLPSGPLQDAGKGGLAGYRRGPPRRPSNAAPSSPPGCASGYLWLSPAAAAAPARSCSPEAPHWSHASAAGASQRQQSSGLLSAAAL